MPVLFRDIAVNPFLKDTTFVLHDIDLERNDELAHACRAIARKTGTNIRVETESNLNRALTGAAAVVLCISTRRAGRDGDRPGNSQAPWNLSIRRRLHRAGGHFPYPAQYPDRGRPGASDGGLLPECMAAQPDQPDEPDRARVQQTSRIRVVDFVTSTRAS